ncbi:MAG: hypothetical protein OXC91_05750 [Rhodobacteraceae bacterium]|nr:hypothetical protein [Paracoccaceae bacterium]
MKLTNMHGAVSLQALGAMLHDCVFKLNGKQVRPLYDPPWRSDHGGNLDALPPILRKMGSEWPCVPFGRTQEQLQLPTEWDVSESAADWDSWVHGYSSNSDWQLEQLNARTLRATIHYPEQTPILHLERTVELLEDMPGIALSLTIHAHRETRFPLGLHPILSMAGAASGTLRLAVPDHARVWSFPVDVEPGRGHFSPSQQDCPPGQVRTSTGDITDIRLLPPEGRTEDLLLLTRTDGAVGLVNAAQGYTTTVRWDTEHLPGCLLWISNGGRDAYPWNGRVQALGVEPVASAFDLGMAHSLAHDTPLARHGLQTSISVLPGTPFACKYTILITPN